ncbi:hypothetical protein EJ04DRAFT_467218 [Polyplosphaeria fusca]|uniref:Nucleolar 27S pre-rRNA processing Urb2/Npa2 C-terminal domain-containing protein n=1 Tax=Polyplosphaeria fusca TaxID=682080 RepID=A0A9P4QUN9_9PLEO|nr:hypothetical protein EJ04DRAFT_467218 [Polyplosphaeria fusca]
MAPDNSAPATSAATLPKLLATGKSAEALDEQLNQIAHTIGLPEDWDKIQGKVKHNGIQRLVRARADWVLRWILDKWKDSTARANPRTWKLLVWTIEILPTSRCAIQLRDAKFLGILEETLRENCERAPVPLNRHHSQDGSDSSESETARENRMLSRKRKRPSPGGSTPLKRRAIDSSGFTELFIAVAMAMTAMKDKSDARRTNEDSINAEHMKMALRTESWQAARLLKFWLSSIHSVLDAETGASILLQSPDKCLTLSNALLIWELRDIEPQDDSGASVEQFSTECLTETVTLYNALQGNSMSETSQAEDNARSNLERTLARHLFLPAKAAFFAEFPAQSTTLRRATSLASSLQPLRAKIEQAAEILDQQSLPSAFLPFFHAIPLLFELAIRQSPFRSPKIKSIETRWIQAVFVAFAECAGCPLEEPAYPVPSLSIGALTELLRILEHERIDINTGVLRDIFWYHSGFKFPVKQERIVHWSLIAALAGLDPDLFLAIARPEQLASAILPNDLAGFLFDEISATNADVLRLTWTDPVATLFPRPAQLDRQSDDRNLNLRDKIIWSIIIPILSAFARNRDLEGFLRRWDIQLCNAGYSSSNPPTDVQSDLWMDCTLIKAVGKLFEPSLTTTQIKKLFERHAACVQMKEDTEGSSETESPSSSKSRSSAVIIHAMLEGIRLDEVVECLRPRLLSLLKFYGTAIQNEEFQANSNLGITWKTLSQLLSILWPTDLHASVIIQEGTIKNIMQQAMLDLSSHRKKRSQQPLDSRSRVGALLFLLAACDHLRTVSHWDDLVREAVRKALKSFSSSKFESEELGKIIEIFCTEYPQLLEHLKPDAREKSLHELQAKIFKYADPGSRAQIATALSQYIFSNGGAEVREGYAAALLAGFDTIDDDKCSDSTTTIALLHIHPIALSRSRREAAIDKVTDLLLCGPRDVDVLLSIINNLMQVSNATSKVSSNPKVLFKICDRLKEANLESSSTLQGLQDLVRSTLRQILLNETQTQNKQYLEAIRSKLLSIAKKPRKCSTHTLAVFRAVVLEQGNSQLLPLITYIGLLVSCVNNEAIFIDHLLEAFNELSSTILSQRGNDMSSELTSLAKSITSSVSLDDIIDSTESIRASRIPWPTLLRMHALLGIYPLYPNVTWFLQLSVRLLQEQTTPKDEDSIFNTMRQVFTHLDQSERLSLASQLLSNEGTQQAQFRALTALISAFDDSMPDDVELKQQQLAIVPKLCGILAKCSSVPSLNALLDTVDTILNHKSSLLSQHSVEAIIATLVGLTSRNSAPLPTGMGSAIYSRLSQTSRLLLLLQRSRLGGRFHLLLPLLQNLLLCLFIPNAGRGAARPAWLKSSLTPVTPANASQYARLLSTLCSPPPSAVSKLHQRHNNTKDSLNDPVKAAKERASQYLYPLLGAFCRFLLNGRLDPLVREKLMPGIWETISVASMDRDALDSMFAGLDKSSKDVWKGVWEEHTKTQGKPSGRNNI